VLSLFKRYRELIVVTGLLVYPFVGLLARGKGAREPNVVDQVVIAVSSPIQRGLGAVVDGLGGGLTGYVALVGIREAHQALEVENARLRAQVQQLEEARLQNERLTRLLDFAQARPGQVIAARVIGVNPVATLLSVRLNRGSDEGVQRGMAVATSDGAVGQVIRVTGGWADVVLLTDPSSRIGVRVQRSRARGTAAGAGGDRPLVLENFLRTDDIEEGDALVTSGTDGVFPPGLMVGQATQINRMQGMFQSAEIDPAVDTTRLEEVLVLPQVAVQAGPVGEGKR
jgi:rod shape-determining protein MreC